MKYYISKSFFAIVYSFFSALTSFVILFIENLTWLKAVLLAVNLGLYIYVVTAVAFQDGQAALKVRIANDLERREIIRTGEDRPLKLSEEFKPWKGYVIGLLSCAPLIILMVVHAILTSVDPTKTGAGAIAGFLYMAVFAFFRMDSIQVTDINDAMVDTIQKNTTLEPSIFYWTLLIVPVLIICIGVGYYLGGRKIEKQQERIREHQKMLHGE